MSEPVCPTCGGTKDNPQRIGDPKRANYVCVDWFHAPQSAEGEAAPKPKWYITTGVKMENGARLRGYGPYATREEALDERTKLEQTTSATYWVEELDEA